MSFSGKAGSEILSLHAPIAEGSLCAFRYLSTLVSPQDFTSAFSASPAFQSDTGDKGRELEAIAAFYNTPGQCLILFDDSVANQRYAAETGAVFQQVAE